MMYRSLIGAIALVALCIVGGSAQAQNTTQNDASSMTRQNIRLVRPEASVARARLV
jgi:hypothetical protein